MVNRGVLTVVWLWVWCSTLIMIYLPYPFVRRIRKEQAVGPASIVPLLSLLANSHVWVMYGFLDRAWFPNFPAFLIGDIASIFYIFIYWRYSKERRHVARVIAVVAAVLSVPTLYVTIGFLGFTGQTREEVWKTHGLCFCDATVMSLSTLMFKNLVRAFKQESAASLNLWTLVAGTFNTFGWFTFGVVTSNWVIAGPQVFVIALHIAAWTMYVVFTRRTSPETIKDDDTDEHSMSCDVGVVLEQGGLDCGQEFQGLSSPKNES